MATTAAAVPPDMQEAVTQEPEPQAHPPVPTVQPEASVQTAMEDSVPSVTMPVGESSVEEPTVPEPTVQVPEPTVQVPEPTVQLPEPTVQMPEPTTVQVPEPTAVQVPEPTTVQVPSVQHAEPTVHTVQQQPQGGAPLPPLPPFIPF